MSNLTIDRCTAGLHTETTTYHFPWVVTLERKDVSGDAPCSKLLQSRPTSYESPPYLREHSQDEANCLGNKGQAA